MTGRLQCRVCGSVIDGGSYLETVTTLKSITPNIVERLPDRPLATLQAHAVCFVGEGLKALGKGE